MKEIVVETAYNILQNSNEVKNVFDTIRIGSKVISMLRTIDEETFQPQVGFRIVNSGRPSYAEYYIVAIEHLIDSGVDIKQFELV